MANTALSVYAYGNVDALHGIFNAVAMIMNDGDFLNAVRVGAVLGFLVVAILAIFPDNLRKGWTWFLSVTVISGVMLVPKATVSIEDRLGLQPTVVVDNVPWTLALAAHVKSSIGAALTQAFETAFQTIPNANRALPSELSYLQHGMMFGSRLVRTSRDAVPENLYDQTDLVQYIRNCVFPAMGRDATPNALADSPNLRADMASTNLALASSYHDPSANWALVVDGCANVWAALQTRLNAAGVNAVKKAASRDLADLYKRDPAAAIDAVEQGLPAIYGRATLASAASSAADIMVQNILINATADAAALQGASLNDSSLIQLAAMRTQAVSQMNAGNVVQGQIAEQSLPLVRNITEGILFAVFPVLCILAVASEGRALAALLKSYIYALIWVELWPPMFAIVNYLQTLAAAKDLPGSAYVPGGGSALTIGTASAVYSTSVSELGTAAWMVTFVPVIAAACLFGFDRIMAITGAMGGGQRAAQGEAANATKGNFSAGNVSMQQQQLMPSWSDPTAYRKETVGGTEFGSALTGAAALSQFREASAPVTLADTAAVTRSMAAEAASAEASAHRNSKGYDRALDAAFGQVQAIAKGYGATAQRTLGFDVGEMSSDGLTESDVRESAKGIAHRYSISDVSAVEKSLRAGAALPGLLQLQGGASSKEGENLQKDITSSAQELAKKGTQRKVDVVNQFRSSSSFAEARRSNREAADRVDSTMREAESYRRAESVDLSRSHELRTKIEGAERFQREASVRWNNLLDQYARVHHGVSVHDGVADPRQWQGIVRSFIESGTIRTDTDDGKAMWIPPDPGMGLNVVRAPTGDVRVLASGGHAVLEREFDATTPGGGESAVQAAKQGFDGRAAKRGAQLGVQPNATVGAGDLPRLVHGHHATARQDVESAQGEAKSAAGKSRNKYDERASHVSGAHSPVLTQNPFTKDRIANKALDGVRGTDGSLPQTFSDEAAKERAREAEQTERLRQQMREGKNAQIPK